MRSYDYPIFEWDYPSLIVMQTVFTFLSNIFTNTLILIVELARSYYNLKDCQVGDSTAQYAKPPSERRVTPSSFQRQPLTLGNRRQFDFADFKNSYV